MLRTICAEPGCPAIATGRSRCDAHRTERNREHNAKRIRGYSNQQRAKRVLRKARHRCFYCPARATVADHYIPIVRGGVDDESNLVAACVPCNSEKGDQMPVEFMASRLSVNV